MRFFARATWAAERLISAVSSGAAKVAKATRVLPASLLLTQLQQENQAHWNVPEINYALELHELGDFSESAKLASAFGRDDRISACRGTRIRALIGKNGAKFEVVPSETGDQRRSSSVCDRVRKLYFECFNEGVVTKILASVIDVGVSVSRIHWERKNGEWLPRLEPWDMRWVRWDHFRKAYIVQAEQGEVEVTQNTGEWLVVDVGWMAGAVRALSMAFFFRAMTWKDWARYCEKHGVPILAIEEPPASTDTTKKENREKFFERLKRLGRDGILRLPRDTQGKGGFDAKIVEPSTISWPSFEAFLKRLDVCIAVFLLGQNLSTEVQGGSLAAAVAQNRVRLDYLAADAELLSTAFRSQVLMFWGRFNIEGWNDELAPWPKWDTAEPEDQKSKSLVAVNVGTALQSFKKHNSPVDERAFLEQYSIPVLSKEDYEKLLAEQAKRAAEATKLQQQNAPAKSDEKTDDDTKDEKSPAKSDDEDSSNALAERVEAIASSFAKFCAETVHRDEFAASLAPLISTAESLDGLATACLERLEASRSVQQATAEFTERAVRAVEASLRAAVTSMNDFQAAAETRFEAFEVGQTGLTNMVIALESRTASDAAELRSRVEALRGGEGEG